MLLDNASIAFGIETAIDAPDVSEAHVQRILSQFLTDRQPDTVHTGDQDGYLRTKAQRGSDEPDKDVGEKFRPGTCSQECFNSIPDISDVVTRFKRGIPRCKFLTAHSSFPNSS